MNPSYTGGQNNSGANPGNIPNVPASNPPASNVPGVKPGVIASGPDPVNTPASVANISVGGAAKPKRSNRGLIIGGIVSIVVMVIALVALVIVQNNGGGGGKNISVTGFDNIKNYVENGTGFEITGFNENGEEMKTTIKVDGNMIYAIEIGNESASTIAKYYQDLKSKTESLSADQKSSAPSLNRYVVDLRVLANAINKAEVAKELLTVYSSNGDAGAQEYFDKNIACETTYENDKTSDDKNISDVADVVYEDATGNINNDTGASNTLSAMASVCAVEESYYRRILSEHKIYSDAGCVKDGAYDTECAIARYGEQTFMQESSWSGVSQRLLNNLSSEGIKIILNSEIISTGAKVATELGGGR